MGALEIGEPWKVLVLVILSARTKDEQVLRLAPRLFRRFDTIEKLAVADVAAITATINTIGMYKQKAKNLKGMAERVVQEFDGFVPSTMEDLMSLKGVGRKTASVVLSACFDVPAIAVDTHVFRVSKRLGWAKGKTVERVEEELCDAVPKKNWREINRVFVPFGRAICTPAPRCWACSVKDLCAYKQKNLNVPANADAVLAAIAKREAEFVRLKREVVQSL